MSEIALHRKLIPVKPAFNILGGTVMAVSEDEIILRSTDLTTTMVSTICDHGIRVNEASVFVFRDHQFVRSLSSKKVESIDFNKEKSTVCFNGELVFNVCDADLFPVIPSDFGEERWVFDAVDVEPIKRLAKYSKRTALFYGDHLLFSGQNESQTSEVIFTDSKIIAKNTIWPASGDVGQGVMVPCKMFSLLQGSNFTVEGYEKYCVTKDLFLPKGVLRHFITSIPAGEYPRYDLPYSDPIVNSVCFDMKSLNAIVSLGKTLRCTAVAFFVKKDTLATAKLLKYNDVEQSVPMSCDFSGDNSQDIEFMVSFPHFANIMSNIKRQVSEIHIGKTTVHFDIDNAVLMNMKIPGSCYEAD